MSDPHSIIASSVKLYHAPVGETFPDVDDEPSGNWQLLGTFGDKSYAEEGVTFTQTETVEDTMALGTTFPVKSFRTQEGISVTVPLMDLTLEQYRQRLNFNVVQDVAAGSGSPGYRHVPLYKGSNVRYRALLIRGDFSAYGVGNAQVEIHRARPDGDGVMAFTKGEPVTVEANWIVLENLNAANDAERIGRFVQQYALPT